jgi:hypothetical protein
VSKNAILRYFEYKHLPVHLQTISRIMNDTARTIDALVPDGPEKSAGLRKLLEAKDCFVRAALPREPAPALVPCKRNDPENCGCGYCTHVRNYRS